MPINSSDNTKVPRPRYVPTAKEVYSINSKRKQQAPKDQMYDTQKADTAQNLQNAYNTNFFGFALSNYQPQISPTTQEGQAAIQANANYTLYNIERFAEELAANGIIEGINFLTSLREVGEGAESIVYGRLFPGTSLEKVGNVSRGETHIRSMTPGAVRSTYTGRTVDGRHITRQPRVKANVSPQKEQKLLQALDKLMASKHWKRLVNEDYGGRAYVKGNRVVCDIEGNIGQHYFTGKPALFDHSVLDLKSFQAAYNKRGGRIHKCGLGDILQKGYAYLFNNKEGSFGEAFNSARADGDKYFRWNGSLYNTQLKDTSIQKTQVPDLDIYHIFKQKDFDEFVRVLTPIFKYSLEKNGFSTSQLQNLIRQAALESDYGMSPRGSQKYNLGGIKWENNPKSNTYKYKHTPYTDKEEYVDFDSLLDYADYKINLLNETYDALNAVDTADFIDRLHGKNKYKKSYSADVQSYRRNLNHMTSLDTAFNNYVSSMRYGGVFRTYGLRQLKLNF